MNTSAKNIFATLFFGLVFVITNAQSAAIDIGDVFKKSNEQWLCKELLYDYPDFFASEHPEIRKPNIAGISALNITIGKDRFVEYENLFFPGGSNKRFLLLRSLCDLYFPLFEKKLSAAGLPEQYKYLPLILSGLNQSHESYDARAGLWSLSYLAARSEHLRVDGNIDERKGADFTTDAAVKFLSRVHNSCNNDHIKTILAFFRSVPYLEKKNLLSADIDINQLEPDDRFLVELVVYTINLFESSPGVNMLQHYFDILGNYEGVFLNENAELAALNAVLGVDINHFHETNPVYTGDKIEGNYRKVPFLLTLEQKLKLNQTQDSIYKWKPPTPVVMEENWAEEKSYYKVRRGDSLGKIAAKHHVTVKQLKAWNGLRKDRINEGQRLVIIKKIRKPMPQPEVVNKEASPVDSTKIEVKSKEPNEPVVVPAVPKEQIITHKVKAGESLWLIAKKYPGTTPEKIMSWNKCSENIQPGQLLKIHVTRKK